MATELDLFYKSPGEELFDNLTKDQLLEVADKYKIPLTTKDKQLKRTVAVIVKAALVKLYILSVGEFAAGDNDGAGQIAANVLSLSFEQQRDLMFLEIEKSKLNREVEIRRLEVEAMCFQLIGEGKLGMFRVKKGWMWPIMLSCHPNLVKLMLTHFFVCSSVWQML